MDPPFPLQPVEFYHRHHVQDDRIDCRYCHLIGFALLDVRTRDAEPSERSPAQAEGAVSWWSAPVSPVERGPREQPKAEAIQREESP